MHNPAIVYIWNDFIYIGNALGLEIVPGKGDRTFPALHDCRPTCTWLIDAAYIGYTGGMGLLATCDSPSLRPWWVVIFKIIEEISLVFADYELTTLLTSLTPKPLMIRKLFLLLANLYFK